MSNVAGIYVLLEGTDNSVGPIQLVRELVYTSDKKALRYKSCDGQVHYFYEHMLHKDLGDISGGDSQNNDYQHLTTTQLNMLNKLNGLSGASNSNITVNFTGNNAVINTGFDSNYFSVINQVLTLKNGLTSPIRYADTVTISNDYDLVTKAWIQSNIQGASWLDPVIDIINATNKPSSPANGDRYISVGTSGGWIDDYIYQWNGSVWVPTQSIQGNIVWVNNQNATYQYNGLSWNPLSGTAQHNLLLGLTGGNNVTKDYFHLNSAEHTGVVNTTLAGNNGLVYSGVTSGTNQLKTSNFVVYNESSKSIGFLNEAKISYSDSLYFIRNMSFSRTGVDSIIIGDYLNTSITALLYNITSIGVNTFKSAVNSLSISNMVTVGDNVAANSTGTQYANSVLMGTWAGDSVGNLTNTVGIGDSVLSGSNKNFSNVVAIGSTVLLNCSASDTVAIGGFALARCKTNNTTNNVAIGTNSGLDSSSSYVTAIGGNTLSNATATEVVAIGYSAGMYTNSTNSVYIGDYSGKRNNGVTTAASNNVSVGYNSAFNSTGSNCTSVGYASLLQNTGSNVIAIGQSAGLNNSGSNCIFIGSPISGQAGYSNITSNRLFINSPAGISLVTGDLTYNEFKFKHITHEVLTPTGTVNGTTYTYTIDVKNGNMSEINGSSWSAGTNVVINLTSCMIGGQYQVRVNRTSAITLGTVTVNVTLSSGNTITVKKPSGTEYLKANSLVDLLSIAIHNTSSALVVSANNFV